MRVKPIGKRITSQCLSKECHGQVNETEATLAISCLEAKKESVGRCKVSTADVNTEEIAAETKKAVWLIKAPISQ